MVQTKVEQDLDLFFGATLVITIQSSFLVLDDRSIFVKTAGILRIHKLMFLFCFHVAPPAGAVLTVGGINNFHEIMTKAEKANEKRISVKNCRLSIKLIK